VNFKKIFASVSSQKCGEAFFSSLMKYGAHSYIFTERWSDDQLHILDTAKELGLSMVEIAVGDDVFFDRRRSGKHAASLGLDLFVGPGGVWPLECDLSADEPENRARGLTWHKRQVDAAAELSAVAYAGALYGHPGVVQRRPPPSDEYPRTAEGLHALAEYAAARNVVIALEPMSHFRSHMVNTPEQVMRLIGLADHTNLRVLFDTYHFVTEIRSYEAALRTIAPSLYALHACENDRGTPGGGLIPWEAIFSVLRETGFSGYVSLESYNSSVGDFAIQRGLFHNVCPDGRAFTERGIAFLKRMEAKARK
jgi:D-psicose/D-tagatose/L-ribulose 3-epimerase